MVRSANFYDHMLPLVAAFVVCYFLSKGVDLFWPRGYEPGLTIGYCAAKLGFRITQ